jgi:hypothetical protein
MSKSLFTNNNSKAIVTARTTISRSSTGDELEKIKNLLTSNFAINIQNVIRFYYDGNFVKVLELLSKENLTNYSRLLESYKKSSISYPAYESVRLVLKLYLQGLTKSLDQYLELVNSQSKVSALEERTAILDNMEKLQEYINGLNRTVNLFRNIPPVAVVEAKILPEHATYIRKYGYPVGGIFDVKLLNEIISTFDKSGAKLHI